MKYDTLTQQVVCGECGFKLRDSVCNVCGKDWGSTLMAKAKQKFAFPGGYPMHATTDDGEMLCHECINEPEVHEDGESDGWRIEAVDIFWEGEATCGHCGADIESAYGPVEEEEEEYDNMKEIDEAYERERRGE